MLNLYMALGAVGTRYNPLINYKWNVLPIASDYVTDGVELVTNGGFDTDLSGWSSLGATWVDGRVYLDATINGGAYVAQNFPTIGEFYTVTCDLEVLTGELKIQVGGSISAYGVGIHSVDVTLECTTQEYVYIARVGADATGYADNYSCKKVIQEPNKRYLRDSGTSKSPMALYSGAGVKLNGVDQSAEIEVIKVSNTIKSDFSISFYANYDNYVIGNPSYKNYISLQTTYTRCIFGGKLYDFQHIYKFVAGVYTFNGTQTSVSMFYNGVLVQSLPRLEDSSLIEFTTVGKQDTAFSTGVLGNLIAISQALTPTQIEYQYNYPEKFLYWEAVTNAGVKTFTPKSYILSDTELSNVVAHLPMTDTDNYTRNMVGYSETALTTHNENIDGVGNTITYDASSNLFTINQVDFTLAVYKPFIGKPETFVAGNLYLFKAKITVVSGATSLSAMEYGSSDGANLANYYNKPLVAGDVHEVYTIGNYRSNGYANLLFDGTQNNAAVFTVEFDALKLSNTYPIQNYTASVRDEAKNLTTGLQASLLDIDKLGVIQGSSFDRLYMDGTAIPALKIPMTDTELNEANGGNWQIEMVIKRELILERTHMIYSLDSIKGFEIIVNYGDGSELFVIRFYDGSSYIQALDLLDSTVHHIVLTVTPTEMYITVDGVKGNVVAHNFVPSGLSFADSIQASPTGQLRLFKIHKEYQDETKLYNKAVNAGLLN